MKTVTIGYPRQQRKALKVEFPGGMVTVTTGLTNRKGEPVVNVSVSADSDQFSGEPQHWAHWGETTARGGGVRIIQHPHNKVPYGKCPICRHYGEDCTGDPAVIEHYER